MAVLTHAEHGFVLLRLDEFVSGGRRRQLGLRRHVLGVAARIGAVLETARDVQLDLPPVHTLRSAGDATCTPRVHGEEQREREEYNLVARNRPGNARLLSI